MTEQELITQLEAAGIRCGAPVDAIHDNALRAQVLGCVWLQMPVVTDQGLFPFYYYKFNDGSVLPHPDTAGQFKAVL